MRHANIVTTGFLGLVTLAAIFLVSRDAYAHCDTLDGPVVQDARKAIEAGDVTPVLKWVKPGDEKALRAAFQKLRAVKGKNREAAERKFFASLVKIHRAGEGAPYTGLKPAGTVEPAVAEADRALADGSPDALVKLITDDAAAGIRKRYEQAASTYRHKDESVAQGRKFVEAYVEYTHYVERLHRDATAAASHGEHGGHAGHAKKNHHDEHAP